MGQTRLIFGALALVFCQAVSAQAADLGLPPPPPLSAEPMVAPAPLEEGCCDQGWYMKGFLGTTNYDVGSLDNAAFDTGNFTEINQGFESSGFGGLGVGYKWNHWLRFDTTFEYRGKSTFHGLDSYDNGGGDFGTNDYEATLKSWIWMTSAYWDIICWNGLTPYVGAGIGYARNYIEDYSDVNVPNAGVAWASTHAESSLAWAVHAGVAYEVNNRVTIDVAYRYLDLGDAMSGDITNYSGGTADGLEFNDLHSHDLMLGVRWKFGPGCCGGDVFPVAFK